MATTIAPPQIEKARLFERLKSLRTVWGAFMAMILVVVEGGFFRLVQVKKCTCRAAPRVFF
jgi:hypothetical protein